MAERIRHCVGCGKHDDHPRHVIARGGRQELWHMDCHVISSGCETCQQQIAGAENLKGDDLRSHLLSLREARNG